MVPGGTMRNLRFADGWVEWDPGVSQTSRVIAVDAQTSGGLLLAAVPAIAAVVAGGADPEFPIAVVGRLREGVAGTVRLLSWSRPPRRPPYVPEHRGVAGRGWHDGEAARGPIPTRHRPCAVISDLPRLTNLPHPACNEHTKRSLHGHTPRWGRCRLADRQHRSALSSMSLMAGHSRTASPRSTRVCYVSSQGQSAGRVRMR
jgi:hypothetical protein